MADVPTDSETSLREAIDAITRDYAACARQADFDPVGYFDRLRCMIEARATTLAAVAAKGPMGGGGPNEA